MSFIQAAQSTDDGQSHNCPGRGSVKLGTLYLAHRGHAVGAKFSLKDKLVYLISRLTEFQPIYSTLAVWTHPFQAEEVSG